MASPGLKALHAAVKEAAIGAGAKLHEGFLLPRTVEFKGGIDLVTDMDRKAERHILQIIDERFPDHSVLAEESGARKGSSDYRWIIDPLDGTTNYSHQVPHYCVSIGVEMAGELVVGVIYDPVRDECFSAVRGEGATLNDRPLHVSNTASLDRALLCTGFPYDVRERPDAPVGLFNRFIRKAQGVRRMGSAALDLAYVAAGRYDGFFEFGLKPWDVAAGALIIREAGGVASGIRGEPLQLDAAHLLACNAALEPVLREECRAFLDELGWKPKR